MSDNTKIEWCDSTFNPWIGCTKVGPGCDHCYAERDMDIRRHRVKWGAGQARSRTSAQYWKQPLRWNGAPFFECSGGCGFRGERNSFLAGGVVCPRCSKWNPVPARRRVFCASLADVFDNEVDPQWRRDLFGLIRDTPNLDWLLLTKRIGAAGKMINDTLGLLPPNAWLGATIVNQEEADRDIPKLRALRRYSRVLFLSCEPLLGPIDLYPSAYSSCPNAGDGLMMDPTTGAYECCKRCDYTGVGDEMGIDWVIAGGESGPGARPTHPDWIRGLRDRCREAGVPFLFKQWGEYASVSEVAGAGAHFKFPDGATVRRVGKKVAGRTLDRVEHTAFPQVLA